MPSNARASAHSYICRACGEPTPLRLQSRYRGRNSPHSLWMCPPCRKRELARRAQIRHKRKVAAIIAADPPPQPTGWDAWLAACDKWAHTITVNLSKSYRANRPAHAVYYNAMRTINERVRARCQLAKDRNDYPPTTHPEFTAHELRSPTPATLTVMMRIEDMDLLSYSARRAGMTRAAQLWDKRKEIRYGA